MKSAEVETAAVVPHAAWGDLPVDSREVAGAALVLGHAGVALPIHVRESAAGFVALFPEAVVTLAAARRAGLARIPVLLWVEGVLPSALRAASWILAGGGRFIHAAVLLSWVAREFDIDAVDLARRGSLPLEVVKRCLLVDELPVAARVAVAGGFPLETALEVLRVEAAERETAWQAVWRPDFQDSPLSTGQARRLLDHWYIQPARRREDWRVHRERYAAALREEFSDDAGLSIIAIEEFGEGDPFMKVSLPGREAIPSVYRGRKASPGMTWAAAAAALGVPAVAVPAAGGGAELRISRAALHAAASVAGGLELLNSHFISRALSPRS